MSKEPESGRRTRGKAPKNPTIELPPVELQASAHKSEMLKALDVFADNLKKISLKVDLASHDTYGITLVFHDSSNKTSMTFHALCNNGNGNGLPG
jgi:hypothetical protein